MVLIALLNFFLTDSREGAVHNVFRLREVVKVPIYAETILTLPSPDVLHVYGVIEVFG